MVCIVPKVTQKREHFNESESKLQSKVDQFINDKRKIDEQHPLLGKVEMSFVRHKKDATCHILSFAENERTNECTQLQETLHFVCKHAASKYHYLYL